MKRFILLVARLYPRSWRQRYGDGFDALLEDLNPSWWDALDVLKGAATMQMTGWIVVGAAFLGTVALAGAAVFFLAHHHTEHASAQTAEAEFQRLPRSLCRPEPSPRHGRATAAY
jgi:hypothetical protein